MSLKHTDFGKVLGFVSPWLGVGGFAITRVPGSWRFGAREDKVDELMVVLVEEKSDTELSTVADLLDDG